MQADLQALLSPHIPPTSLSLPLGLTLIVHLLSALGTP